MSGDDYVHKNELLKNIIQQEKEAWFRRRENHDAAPQANDAKDELNTYVYNN